MPWLYRRADVAVGTGTFLRPVVPIAGESLLSLVSRAAGNNGHDELGSVLFHVGASLNADRLSDHRDVVLPEFAALLNLPPDEIAARYHANLAFAPSGRCTDVSFFGSAVPKRWVSWEKRVAPLTMQCSGYHSSLWEIQLFEVCPESGEPLMERCCSCGAELRWRVTDLGTCDRCGQHLTAGVPEGWDGVERDLSGVRFLCPRRE